MAIKDGKLYRETHTSFESYCSETFDSTARIVNYNIAAAKAALSLRDSVGEMPDIPAAKTLARQPEEDRTEIYKAAKSIAEDRGDSTVTSRDVLAAAADRDVVLPPPKEEARRMPPSADPATMWQMKFDNGVVQTGVSILQERGRELGMALRHPLAADVKRLLDELSVAFGKFNNGA